MKKNKQDATNTKVPSFESPTHFLVTDVPKKMEILDVECGAEPKGDVNVDLFQNDLRQWSSLDPEERV